MTQHDLARAVEMPQSTIARIEAGAVTPMAATLIALLGATGHELRVEPMKPTVDVEAVRRQLRTNVADRARAGLGRRGKDRATSPLWLLSRLGWFGVPYVVIGDVAEVVHGRTGSIGPSLELCMDSTDVARERLQKALDELGSRAAAGGLTAVSWRMPCGRGSTPG